MATNIVKQHATWRPHIVPKFTNLFILRQTDNNTTAKASEYSRDDTRSHKRKNSIGEKHDALQSSTFNSVCTMDKPDERRFKDSTF
uniref:Ovule protein n=1 Tax=Ascaris lumbricoides TaxID=6252 RepID=A0A0M3HYJ2_ASCLU